MKLRKYINEGIDVDETINELSTISTKIRKSIDWMKKDKANKKAIKFMVDASKAVNKAIEIIVGD